MGADSRRLVHAGDLLIDLTPEFVYFSSSWYVSFASLVPVDSFSGEWGRCSFPSIIWCSLSWLGQAGGEQSMRQILDLPPARRLNRTFRILLFSLFMIVECVYSKAEDVMWCKVLAIEYRYRACFIFGWAMRHSPWQVRRPLHHAENQNEITCVLEINF